MEIFDTLALEGIFQVIKYWWFLSILILSWIASVLFMIIAIKYLWHGIIKVNKYRDDN